MTGRGMAAAVILSVIYGPLTAWTAIGYGSLLLQAPVGGQVAPFFVILAILSWALLILGFRRIPSLYQRERRVPGRKILAFYLLPAVYSSPALLILFTGIALPFTDQVRLQLIWIGMLMFHTIVLGLATWSLRGKVS